MTANLGGKKIGDPSSSYAQYSFTNYFTGDKAIVRAKFQFDTKPPSHCLLESTNCTMFPITIDQDITAVKQYFNSLQSELRIALVLTLNVKVRQIFHSFLSNKSVKIWI